MIPFRVVIPARYGSSRFPGKPLAMLAGRTVLEHVWQRARASGAMEVVIATDDERIAVAARALGADVQLTGTTHRSGTERVAEVSEIRNWAESDLVVNCQGDAPLMPPAAINQVAGLLAAHPHAALATLCTPITDWSDYHSAHVVKVVCAADGRALYFSRAPIPAVAHGSADGSARGTEGGPAALPPGLRHLGLRHLGLYAYRVGRLRQLAAAPPCELEMLESLEQLRALWLGLAIQVGRADAALGPDIDTPEDLVRAEAHLRQSGMTA